MADPSSSCPFSWLYSRFGYNPTTVFPPPVAVDVAKSKEDPANMIRAAKELGEYLDMKPKAKQLTESVEVDISHQIKESYEKQTKKLKATKIQVSLGNEEDDHYHKIKG